MEPNNDEKVLRQALTATQAPPWTSAELSTLAQQVLSGDSTGKAQESSPRTGRRFGAEPRRSSWTRIGIGAVAMTVLAAGWFVTQHGPATSSVSTAAHTYTTQRAQRATIPLPDGSQAILGPATRMTYTESPNGERIITLLGQAYFTVTHDPARQFTVTVQGVTTRVLGTAFSVRGYATDTRTQVAVAEGKVSLETAQDATVLASGEVGEANEKERPRVVRNARISDVFGWMRGQISFDDTPMRDVVPELSRFLDIDIEFSDPSIADRPVTIAISEGNANTALDALALAIDARYTMSGNTIVFSPRESR